MKLWLKVIIIFSIMGFFFPLFYLGDVAWVYTIFYYNILFLIMTPIYGVFAIALIPHIAIPYFATSLSLLYWWEKKKRVKVKMENVV